MCAYDISLHAKFSSDCYNLRVTDAQKFTSTTENKIQHNLKNICTHKNELQPRELKVCREVCFFFVVVY